MALALGKGWSRWAGRVGLLLGLLLPRLSAGGELLLVEDGRPRATIVVASDAPEKTRTAAEQLQRYITRITGASLVITSDRERHRGPLVLVGRSRLTEAAHVAVPSGLSSSRREEGFVIHCDGSRLVLAGNDAGPYHGTEYAVYDLLRRLGVRWFMPGEFGEIVPARRTISVPELAFTERPDFVVRNYWIHTTPALAALDRQWKLRNKMNPDPPFMVPGDSSVRALLPEKLYFKEHPEYFAANADGSRNPHMPNLTLPETVRIVASAIKGRLRMDPAAGSYGFAPDDGLPRDYSPDTLRLHRGFVDLLGRPGVPAEASATEEWLSFVNSVTADVRREFPDAYIATNGYANRNLPPQGMSLNDHLVVMFAAIWSCTLHAYDDPHCWQKTRQGQMLRRWAELSPNVWVYNYQYQMLVSALTPLPETRKLRRDFPLLKKWGVLGCHDEARNQWAENGIASRYLRAQLEWNANADVESILSDFYAQWYGRAAAPMRAFSDAIEDAIERAPVHGHEDRVLPEIYDAGLMTGLSQQLARGEALASTESERQHVHVDRLIYEHLAAYVSLAEAEAAGDWRAAIAACDRMMEARRLLNGISPFLMWADEVPYNGGVWYWRLLDRQKYYQKLLEMTSGARGELVALLPDEAAFRTDERDDGLFAGWYQPEVGPEGWRTVSTTRPFYVQGFTDSRGFPYVGLAWYRFKIDVPASARGKRLLLYAPVVETEAWAWVNGQYVGHRPYTEAYQRPNAMELDVTEALRPGRTNTIALRISTSLSPSQAAAGLQSRLFLYSAKPGAASIP